jgi:hypothetical protein
MLPEKVNVPKRDRHEQNCHESQEIVVDFSFFDANPTRERNLLR